MKRIRNLEIQLLLAEALFLTFSERDGKSIAQWRNPAGQFTSPYDAYPNVLKDQATTEEFEIFLDQGRAGDAIATLVDKGIPLATATKFTSYAQNYRLDKWKEKVPNYQSIVGYMNVGAIDVAKEALEANGLQKGKIKALFEEWEAITGKRDDRPILNSTEEVIHLYTPSETALDDAKEILKLESPEEMLLALMSRGVPLERIKKHGWLDKIGFDLKDVPQKTQEHLPLLVEYFEAQARARLLEFAHDKKDVEFLDKLRSLPVRDQKAELIKKGYTPQQTRAYFAIDQKITAIERYNHVATKKAVDVLKSLIPPKVMEDPEALQQFFMGMSSSTQKNDAQMTIDSIIGELLTGKKANNQKILEERIREAGFREDDPYYNLAVVNTNIHEGLDNIFTTLTYASLGLTGSAIAFGATRALNILLRANSAKMVKDALSVAFETTTWDGASTYERTKIPEQVLKNGTDIVNKVIRVPEILKTTGSLPELSTDALANNLKTALHPAINRGVSDTVSVATKTKIDNINNPNGGIMTAMSLMPPVLSGAIQGTIIANMIANSNDKLFQEMRANFKQEYLSGYISKVQELVTKYKLQEISFDAEKIVAGDFSELKDFIAEMEKKIA